MLNRAMIADAILLIEGLGEKLGRGLPFSATGPNSAIGHMAAMVGHSANYFPVLSANVMRAYGLTLGQLELIHATNEILADEDRPKMVGALLRRFLANAVGGHVMYGDPRKGVSICNSVGCDEAVETGLMVCRYCYDNCECGEMPSHGQAREVRGISQAWCSVQQKWVPPAELKPTVMDDGEDDHPF